MPDALTWIESLKLQPHPEGGHFREVYRSEIEVAESELPDAYTGSRSAGTSIYYLLKSGQRSMLHKILSDEIWHIYDGSPLVLSLIHEDGTFEEKLLGTDISNDEIPQITIKGGTWFGAYPKYDNSFSLAGCTVAPGFDFEDFEMAEREKMLEKFPELENVITKLTED